MMPPLLLALMVCWLVLTLVSFGTLPGWLALAAFALILIDLVVTVRLLVPLNLRLGGFNPHQPPAEAAGVRNRWYALHTLRTGLGGAAFVLLLLARAGLRRG